MKLSNQKQKLVFRIFWITLIIPFITIFLIFLMISTGNLGYIPSFDELENPKSNLASEIFSSDNKLLGKYYKENRTIVQFEDLSANLVNSLIATEDIRFHRHSGIDFIALGRVFKGVVTGNHQGGGSTISQQLAKNLYRMREVLEEERPNPKTKVGKMWNMAIMKFQEWVTAAKLEKNYTKEEIIVMYLNTVPFGHNAFGIKSASRIFFNTTPDSLRIEDAAVLIGLLRAPTYYSPIRNPENSKRRRNIVLSQIEKYQSKLKKLTGFKPMTEEQFDSLRNLPLKAKYTRQSHTEGLSTYFREYLRTTMTAQKPKKENYPSWATQQFIEDSIEWVENPLYGWCHKNKKPDGTSYNIYNDGIKIYTTIDSRMQKYAEESVKEHMGKGYTIKGRTYPPLQKTFEKIELSRRKNAPFSWRLNDKQIDNIIWTSIRRSERYRIAVNRKLDSTKIMKEFKTPTQMTVFTWNGDKDTTMTPYDSILYYKSFLRAGFMSMEPGTGYVKAYVGGIDFIHFKYDHVMQARRQVGSTFKPFVYTLAMMPGGYSPCYQVPNVPVVIDMPPGSPKPTYSPKFSKSKLDGEMISLKLGLALSLNQISAWVIKQYKPKAVIEISRKLGIKSPLEPVYSLCVGSAEVKLSEMIGAYGSYPNKGVWVEPIFVTRIEDKNGNIISIIKPKKREAIDENTAFRMVELMRGVVDYGTSTRIRHTYRLYSQIAGKTGTTNNNSDGWFIGYTPELVSGAWVGGEERSIHFSSTAYGQGASMALPIWALYMRRVLNDPKLNYDKNARFKEPEKSDGIISDCNEYQQNNGDNSNTNYINIDGESF